MRPRRFLILLIAGSLTALVFLALRITFERPQATDRDIAVPVPAKPKPRQVIDIKFISPLRSWTGTIHHEQPRREIPSELWATDLETWTTVWQACRKDELPVVDFTREAVLEPIPELGLRERRLIS